MKILALDTSTEACSVAIWIDGNVFERFELGSQHSARILPMVDEVLAEAGLALPQLDALAFGRGPGSFTGLRIGAGVVQGLAFGAELPVAPVSSLSALAQGQGADKILAAFDARMHQVYWGVYVRNKEGLVELQDKEIVIAPKNVPIPQDEGWVGAGSGWDQYSEDLLQHLNNHVTSWNKHGFPHAQEVALLGAAEFEKGNTVSAEEALPIYIRDEVAVKQVRR